MPDNIYVLDLQVTGATLVTVNDDGAGEDAIAVHGLYDQLVEISLCWTSSGGQTTTAGAYYVDADNQGHRLVVKGIVENAIGSNGRDSIQGNEYGNQLFGDFNVGGPGDADTIRGGLGDDFVHGGVGADSIAGDGDNDRLFGDEGDDIITGGTGIDTIAGGTGADVLSGGGSVGDTLTYASSAAGVRVTLTDGAATTAFGGEAEGDLIDGFTNVTGSAFADRITDTNAQTLPSGANDNVFFGNGGFDRLYLGGGNDCGYGGNGNDLLLGEAGDDTLSGDAGRDRLWGGAGQDSLTGGEAADTFIFRFIADSAVTRADVITDFATLQGDRIDLLGIDAISGLPGNQAFVLISTAFQGQPGELRFEQLGPDLLVMGDTSGDAVADFAIVLLGVNSLTALDFIL